MALCPHHRYFGLIWTLWMFSWLQFVRCDMICNNVAGNPDTLCFGDTAYCCGKYLQRCCTHQVWEFWWFWVMTLVVIVGILSCICFLRHADNLFQRSPTGDGSGCIILAPHSLHDNRQDSRRSPLSSTVLANNRRNQATRRISLPPYSSLSDENTEDSDDVNLITQRGVPYIEPPPPYTIILSRPQPTAEVLVTPLQ